MRGGSGEVDCGGLTALRHLGFGIRSRLVGSGLVRR